MKGRARSLVRDLFLAMMLVSLVGLVLITWQGFRLTGEVLREQAALHPTWSRSAASEATVPTVVEGLQRIQTSLLATAAGALLLATLIAAWLGLLLRRELAELRHGADRIAAGHLDHRLPADRHHAELAVLADSVNRLAQTLSRQIRTLDRQRLEQATLLAGMREGVLALDAGGRVRSCNPAARRLLDLGEHPVGALLADLLPGREVLLAIILRGWEEGESEGELPPDGSGRELRVWTLPLRGAGRNELLLAVISDMSAANAAERLRREFVANVSHELKTPVTSIRGYVETLLDGAAADEATADRFLRVIERQAGRLEAIVDDLLALSRIERQTGAGLPPRELVDLRTLLGQLLEEHEPLARAAEIRLCLEVAAEVPPALPVVRPLLERALGNLLSNAVRYGRPRTDVTMRARLADGERGRGLLLEVQDEGRGIAAQHLPRIFERFYVVDKARSREVGGTGLGLSIVKHAVQAQGGEVGVESVVEAGSRFWIRLPLDPPAAKSADWTPSKSMA
ncbi:MAG: ATP-binding protein [bacterium]|nr:ATP-binding protein [bacterium]